MATLIDIPTSRLWEVLFLKILASICIYILFYWQHSGCTWSYCCLSCRLCLRTHCHLDAWRGKCCFLTKSLQFFFANNNIGSQILGWKPVSSERLRKQLVNLPPPTLWSETKPQLYVPTFYFLCLSFSMTSWLPSLSMVTYSQLVACSASWPTVDFI